MGIEYSVERAVFSGVVGVEQAEGLLGWLQDNAGGGVDLAACTHLHAASLQVLMTARPRVFAWPADLALATWVRSALQRQLASNI